jgi:hypothetical protein
VQISSFINLFGAVGCGYFWSFVVHPNTDPELHKRSHNRFKIRSWAKDGVAVRRTWLSSNPGKVAPREMIRFVKKHPYNHVLYLWFVCSPSMFFAGQKCVIT